jgi:peptidoglycan hydrolase-like protein with peptidoglycan-binding domain
VRSLQDKLRTAGHNPGRTDGVFGQRTEGAVRDFQRAQGLRVDGVAGRRTLAALNGVDRMEPSRPGATGTNRVDPSSPTPNGGVNGTARLNNYPNGPGLATGTITVNGNTYQFNSGSGSRYSVPRGTYNVRRHLDRRTTPGFERDGVGYSYILEDDRRRGSDSMRDPRTGRTRTLLRIHPDGGPRGTQGCIGIVGDAETLLRFQRDLRAELSRNGGRYTLRVE